MAGIYKVTVKIAEDATINLEMASQKSAIQVRDQLNKQGYTAKAELVKVLD